MDLNNDTNFKNKTDINIYSCLNGECIKAKKGYIKYNNDQVAVYNSSSRKLENASYKNTCNSSYDYGTIYYDNNSNFKICMNDETYDYIYNNIFKKNETIFDFINDTFSLYDVYFSNEDENIVGTFMHGKILIYNDLIIIY